MDWPAPQTTQRRRHARRPVRLDAELTWHGQQFVARTENISPGGALLNVELPAEATEVVARIDLNTGKAVRVRARVRWHMASSVGLEFAGFLGPCDPD
jgi:PilZ domain-containing protein